MTGPFLTDLGNPVSDHPLNRGRVLWLPGLPNPHTGGLLWRDLTTKQNHGTLTNGPTWAPSLHGWGVLITTGAAKRVATAMTVAGAAGFTVSGTFKANGFGTGGFGYNVFFGFTSPSYHFLAVDASRNISVWGAGTNVGVFPNDGQWHRITWTHLAGSDTVYVDGVQVGTTTSTHSDTAPFHIGNRSDADQSWDGRIADPGAWSRALSASEARLDYEQSCRGFPDLLRRYEPKIHALRPGPQTVIALTAGTTSFTVPSDWNSSDNTIEAYGPGGHGGAGISNKAGGGAGAYAAITGLSLTPGASITVQIPTGGTAQVTQFRDGSTLVADYGRTPAGNTGGAGGLASNSVGTTKYDGGAGGNAAGGNGAGGGGGSAGPSGAGKAAGAQNGGGGAGGGGGSNGGSSTAGSTVTSTAGGNGGHGTRGVGGGPGGANGVPGTAAAANSGGGGGGGGNGASGANGAQQNLYTDNSGGANNGNTYGPGGGGGGAGSSQNAGAGAGFGGGGGGSRTGTQGNGAPGGIVIRYTPSVGGNANADATGVAGTGAPGTVTATGTANASVTGVTGTGSAGTTSATGTASTTLTGVEATGSPGDPSTTVSPTTTGVSATGSPGTTTASGTANITLTGVEATGSPGTASTEVAPTTTGVEGTGEAGTVTATGTASVTLTGVAGTGSPGTASIEVATPITGVEATGSPGDVTASATSDVEAEPTGVSGTGSPGEPTTAVSPTTTGVEATGSPGTPTASGTANVTLTGVAGTGSAGDASTAVSPTTTGVAATGEPGSATATGAANVTVSGVAATGEPGTVTATASGDATANAPGVAGTGEAGAITATGTANTTLNGVQAVGIAGNAQTAAPAVQPTGGGWSPNWARKRTGKNLDEALRERDDAQRREMLGEDHPDRLIERAALQEQQAAERVNQHTAEEEHREAERQLVLAQLQAELRAALLHRAEADHKTRIRAIRQQIALLERRQTAALNRKRKDEDAFMMLLAV